MFKALKTIGASGAAVAVLGAAHAFAETAASATANVTAAAENAAAAVTNAAGDAAAAVATPLITLSPEQQAQYSAALQQAEQQAQQQQQPGGIASLLITLLPLILIFVVFWFFLIRPQRKKDKKVKEMLNNVKAGDRICTIGGIYGTITSIKDDTVTISVGKENTVMVIARWGIRSVEEVTVENDAEALN